MNEVQYNTIIAGRVRGEAVPIGAGWLLATMPIDDAKVASWAVGWFGAKLENGGDFVKHRQ